MTELHTSESCPRFITEIGHGNGKNGNGHALPSPQDRGAQPVEDFRPVEGAQQCFDQPAAGNLSGPAWREWGRQEHAGQVHYGNLPGRSGRTGQGRRIRRRVEEPPSGPCARHRHGLSALHARREHVGRRKHDHGPRASASHHQLEKGMRPARSVHGPDAVPRQSQGHRSRSLGRGEAEDRVAQATISRTQGDDPRRADVGAHAGRGRRDARHGAADVHRRPAERADDHAQVPRSDGLLRRGHGSPPWQVDGRRFSARSQPGSDGRDDDGQGIDPRTGRARRQARGSGHRAPPGC